MSIETISKITLSIALILCLILLCLDFVNKPQQSGHQEPPKKDIREGKRNKTIQTWSSSVPKSNKDTTKESIIMYTTKNTINYGNNNTFIPLGTYKTEIPIKSNLIVENIGNDKLKLKTTENHQEYYLTYSKNGDKKPEKDLKKGQLYWTTDKNQEIILYKDANNLLFRVDKKGNVTNDQVYFMWYGDDTTSRNTDAGFFLLQDKNTVTLQSNPNLVTYFFEQSI